MSDGRDKPLPTAPDAAPQTGDFGRPEGRQPGDLEATVRRFAKRLRRDFPAADDQAARKLKKQAVSILKRNLPPFAGRPPEKSISRAAELQRQGVPWPEIYPQCIDPQLDPLARSRAKQALRAAVRSRRNSARRRSKPRPNLTAETNPPLNDPSSQNRACDPTLEP